MVQALQLENIIKDYGRLRAVNGVSLSVQPGEIFGLLGPNGAGKTSIISIIVTLEKATAGNASVFGHHVEHETRQAKALTGLVPQEVINHGYFNVDEILRFQSGYHGLRKNQDRIEYILRKLHLIDHRHKRVKELSGGLKRRLMIAKALVHSPKLLLLDEPTAGVDVELRSTLWEFVKDLQKEGVTILLTTHYLEEAERLCDRVAILHKGEIRQMGPTRELIQSLTQRVVRLHLSQGITAVQHQFLHYQSGKLLEFRLPSTMGVGALLADLQLDPRIVSDVQVIEGTLEEAYMSVLDGGKQ